MMKGVLFLIFFGSLSFSLSAQVDFKQNSTEKIAIEPDLYPERYHKPKKLLTIYTKDTKRILYGNPCMEAVTTRFGYEFVVMPNNAEGYTGFQMFTHNLGTKFLLFLRNPLWKIISKKQFKECRQKTGDYNG